MSYEIGNDYRPVNIEFEVVNSSPVVPDNLGRFETSQQAVEFIAKNLNGMNHKLAANRFMDNYEKTQLRKDYQDLLENKLPLCEKEMMKAAQVFSEAKKAYSDSQEYVNATTNEAKALAMEVKRGVVEINLDDMFTWRIPFDSKYYFYTFMDNQIKLCKIQDIPDHEKMDLYNAMNNNDVFFNEKLGVSDVE
jgi:hypothetical protein